MAELLGIIGSSVALVELAAKLSACILNLKALFNEIKDVSTNLSALVREVEILEPIVEALGREFNENKLVDWNDSIVLLSIEYCEKALNDLEAVTRGLVQELDTSRKLGKYKATLKVISRKEALAKCHARLQSAGRCLSLTQQWYIIALLKVQPVIVAEHISRQTLVHTAGRSNARAIPEAIEKLRGRQRSNKVSSSTQGSKGGRGKYRFTNLLDFGPLGWVAWRYYQDEQEPNPTNLKLIARLQANYWFASRIWDFQVSRLATGWTLKLNAYCVQPNSSPVFSCARSGDIHGILQLIGLGKAGLHDRTPSGQNLLYLAAEHDHLDLFKFLVAGGLDPSEADDVRGIKSCEALFVYSLLHVADLGAWDRFYLEHDIYGDILRLTASESAYFFEAVAAWPAAGCRTVLPHVLPGFRDRLTLEERVAYCNLDSPDAYPDTLRLFLDADARIRREDVESLLRKNTCLLALVAFRYGPMAMLGASCRAGPWRELVRDVVGVTADLSFRGGLDLDPTFQSREFLNKGRTSNPVLAFLRRHQPLTPLFTALSYFRYDVPGRRTPTCVRDLERKMQTALTWLLEDLTACGVDLAGYGRRERHIFARDEKLRQAWYYYGDVKYEQGDPVALSEDRIRLVDFDYGAKPSDWRLRFDAETERYAGDFWGSVENLPPHVPGDWVD